MTTTLHLEAPIRVVGYQRTGGNGTRRYKPKATRDCMQAVKVAAFAARKDIIASDRWAHVTVRVHYASRVRPDLDNAVKTVLDALTGVAWVDDRQVEQLGAKIIVGDRDYLFVTVSQGGYINKKPPGHRARVGK